MNPYYTNWSYGYTLQPATDQSRGAYNVQYGASQAQQGIPATWSQIKQENPPLPPPKAQVFVTASVKTEASSSSSATTSATIKSEPSTSSSSAAFKGDFWVVK